MFFKPLAIQEELPTPIKVLTEIGEVECTSKQQKAALLYLEKKLKDFNDDIKKYELVQFFMDPHKVIFNGGKMFGLESLSDDLGLHTNLLRIRVNYYYYLNNIKFNFELLKKINPLERFVIHEGFTKLPRLIENELSNFVSSLKKRLAISICNAVFCYPSITFDQIYEVIGSELFSVDFTKELVLTEIERLLVEDYLVSNNGFYYFIGRNPKNRTSKFHWTLEWNFYK